MSKSIKALLLIALCLTGLVSCSSSTEPKIQQIAFLADIHLHDIYASVDGQSPHHPLPLPVDKNTHAPLLMRSMAAQLGSTRLFNENYFVLKAALDDLVARQVKLVALPGDFSDDGQPINVKAIASLLDQYREQHQMQFFAITGNHDPVRPFTRAGGKSNFLQKNGQELAIYSHEHPQCVNNQAICSDSVSLWGYEEIMDTLSTHGFYPQPEYLYYETPFSTNQDNTQEGNTKLADNSFEQRQLKWCSEDPQAKCINMPDASYLVEPVDGLWLLAIDANVYQFDDPSASTAKPNFKGSSSAGYNAMLTHKQPILDWVQSVVKRAKQQNKQLVAFSHFPMTDFYDGAAQDIKALFGKNAFQMKRMPEAETENALANTGLQLHFAGHMHINDTGTARGDSGSTLFNIQVPSLAAYQPAYKLLTLQGHSAKVETIVLNDVPNYDLLFEHYAAEWHYRDTQQLPNWDKSILEVKSYQALTDKHLQGVVDSRYLPKEWPPELLSLLQQNTGETLLNIAGCQATSIKTLAKDSALSSLSGQSIIYDFYRIRNADHIAAVPQTRLALYLAMHKLLQSPQDCPASAINKPQQVQQFFAILAKMLSAEASANFMIDLHHHRLTPE